MKNIMLTTVAAVALAGTAFAQSATLDAVMERGQLICGVSTGVAGFSIADDGGNYTGLDVDVCRAVAAAVLNDAQAVKFVPLTSKERFTALQSGEIDVLSRNTTWTYTRDVDLGLEFVGVSYYDGQGFMVRKDLGISSASELDGASVCVITGTTTELNLADYFASNGMSYEGVVVETNAETNQNYEAGRCDVFTTDASGLAANRSQMAEPEAHMILPEIISKEPLGPVVRHGDNVWGDIVRWTLNSLIIAEEKGLTGAGVAAAGDSGDPEVRRLVGAEGDKAASLGLDSDAFGRAIAAVGNYGEIFERNVGPNTPVGLERGLNAQWTKGGILYAPPFR